jgi:hypothetical protein
MSNSGTRKLKGERAAVLRRPSLALHSYWKTLCLHRFLRYSSPPQSRNRAAACSGVMSLCGSASISYPTKNFLTEADRKSGG